MTGTVVLLCMKIFFGRILDVSLNTIRMVAIVRKKLALAPIIGFFEVTIWFLIVREALTVEGGGWYAVAAYGLGYACGTLLGSLIAKRFLRGSMEVQVVTRSKNDSMVEAIRAAGYGVSVVDVKGSSFGAEKYMLFIEISEHRLEPLKRLIHSLDEHAFVVVHETQYVRNGFFKLK